MPKALLSGFAPFGGASTNSSWEAVVRVSGIPGLVIACLPVEFGWAGDELLELVARHRPDLVIAVGLADGRTAITPERVAINGAARRLATPPRRLRRR